MNRGAISSAYSRSLANLLGSQICSVRQVRLERASAQKSNVKLVSYMIEFLFCQGGKPSSKPFFDVLAKNQGFEAIKVRPREPHWPKVAISPRRSCKMIARSSFEASHWGRRFILYASRYAHIVLGNIVLGTFVFGNVLCTIDVKTGCTTLNIRVSHRGTGISCRTTGLRFSSIPTSLHAPLKGEQHQIAKTPFAHCVIFETIN